MTRRALFLDRDGTLVHPRHYPSRPEELLIFNGIVPLLHRLQRAGFALVVVTNQAGIARGLLDEQDLERMHMYLKAELASGGVYLDGIYHCPHHVEGVIPALSVGCDCRKPRPGMIVRAARELDLDAGTSWFLGDILDDVEAGNRAGCTTVLCDLGTEARPTADIRKPNFVARDTLHALQLVLTVEGLGDGADLAYLPHSWRAAQESLSV